MADTKDDILRGVEDGSIADELSTPMNAEQIEALIRKAKADPGAPFEPLTLARIAATKRADLPTFIRLREGLKAAKISMAEFDEALGKALHDDEPAGDGEDNGGQGRAITFPEIERWADAVDGAALLDEFVAQIERHVMLPH
jgi:hypothetical protein